MIRFATKTAAALIALALLSSASTAEAQWGRSARRQAYYGGTCPTQATYSYGYAYQYAYTQAAPATQQQATTVAVQQVSYTATATVEHGDAYGFTAWINGVRARYGLRALAWSADAAAHAAINSARGFGHSYLGGTRRQNVGVGQLQTVEAMWLQSSAHLSAIVDPSVTEVGIAYVNGVWTMNAR